MGGEMNEGECGLVGGGVVYVYTHVSVGLGTNESLLARQATPARRSGRAARCVGCALGFSGGFRERAGAAHTTAPPILTFVGLDEAEKVGRRGEAVEPRAVLHDAPVAAKILYHDRRLCVLVVKLFGEGRVHRVEDGVVIAPRARDALLRALRAPPRRQPVVPPRPLASHRPARLFRTRGPCGEGGDDGGRGEGTADVARLGVGEVQLAPRGGGGGGGGGAGCGQHEQS